MRVCALTPYLSELTRAFIGEGSLVATVEASHISPEYSTKLVSTLETSYKKDFLQGLSIHPVNVTAVIESNPDLILTTLQEPSDISKYHQALYQTFNRQIFLYHHDPVRLESVFEMFEQVGKQLGVPEKGHTLSSKMKAQFMDWCNCFYERIKNKRVCIISSINPLTISGRWITDMIKMTSSHSLAPSGLDSDLVVDWSDIVKFNPDVILFAPKNISFAESLKIFPKLEQIPNWDKIYASKRGDIFFADGQKYFHQPTPKLIASMGILISALAGFESGYITERDTMYRLRYLELHRHKFL